MRSDTLFDLDLVVYSIRGQCGLQHSTTETTPLLRLRARSSLTCLTRLTNGLKGNSESHGLFLLETREVRVEEPRLLYDRKSAARQISLSVRSVDYLIANKRLATRRVGKRIMIPHCELVRFARTDHFEPITTSK